MSMRSSARFRSTITGAAVCSALALGSVLAGPGAAVASAETGQNSTSVSAAPCNVIYRVSTNYEGWTANYSWAWNINVAQGATGDRVREIQCLLIHKGFGVGAVDGDFGPATYNAVVAFQKNRGLDYDGIVGANTWSKLRART
ncbi:peptidoglycan-binding domain-containing protein [Streptomyces sp. NPDC052164]|uniref:peptidoglycan-binding domain-containing protein n=1 Tax=Streptomyces sp. NPDC052164 TaxID=3155529 RepID=UPI00343904DF